MNTDSLNAYGWGTAEGPASCGYIAPRVVTELQAIGAKRVLDLGCGNGSLAGLLARAGLDVCGIDRDEEGVSIARAQHPGARFFRMGVDDDPATLLAHEAPFDAVVSTEVVEHLYSPHLLPRFAHAVLRPGGQLIVTTPYHGYLKNLAIAVTGHWDHHHTVLWHGGHIKFWSRATLTELLRTEGFEVQAFGGVGRLPYLWKSMVMRAVRRP